ncbi:hypothetical protein DITRI_Ditri05aG0112800 [Diplodiscus trichospermus]
MSEANSRGARRDDGSSTTPGSSSSTKGGGQARPIKDGPMRQPKRGEIKRRIGADFANIFSSKSSTAR